MISITIPGGELFNESTGEIITSKGYELQLEHSLISVSKWESKWQKSFLSSTDITVEEMIDYIRCMTITKGIPYEAYNFIPDTEYQKIIEYISNPMTATTFSDTRQESSREIVTSELIYYWMVSMNIPPEYEKWHLNRLLTLIRVIGIKNAPAKKRNQSEVNAQQASLNQARRAAAAAKRKG